MARQIRIQYPGAIYHVLARGDRKESIVYCDQDRRSFLRTLGELCQRTGFRIHAWVLLDNHYHLVVETPEANLVDGMSWFQNTYTRRLNVRHDLWGHVFGGRYKALIVDPADIYFGRIVDYVHLNPARAGVVGIGEPLSSYGWSSLAMYRSTPSKRPGWLETGRSMRVFGLNDTVAGRRAFERRLQERIESEGVESAGRITGETAPDMSLQTTIRRGWYFGSEAFKEKMLAWLDEHASKLKAGNEPVKDGYHGSQIRDHGIHRAEEILRMGCEQLGTKMEDLIKRRKGSDEKVLLAELIASETSVRLDWIRERLRMGSRGYCSRLIGQQRLRLEKESALGRRRDAILKKCNKK